jgi:hypothetical protein
MIGWLCECEEKEKAVEEMVAKYCDAWKHRGYK